MDIVKLASLLIALLMLCGGGWLVYRRTPGWGPSTVQAFGLVLLVPTIIILAVTNSLSKEILATLLGGVVGFIFGRSGGGGDR